MQSIKQWLYEPSKRMTMTLALGLTSALALFFWVSQALAQEPTVGELVTAGQGVATAWTELGWIAGITALVTFLVDLTKLGLVAAAIKRNRAQWIRPLLAVVLAVLGGIGAGALRGVPLGLAAAEGLLAGVMAPGFHELWAILTKPGRHKRGIPT